MALPIILDVFRVAFEWETTQGQSATNVMHFLDRLGTRTPAQVFTVIDTNVVTNLWNRVSSSAEVKRLAITPLDGTSSTTTVPCADVAKWNGNAGAEYSPAVSSLVKLQTGLRGRENRGRVYLPFTAETALVNGFFPLGVDQTNWQNSWNLFLNVLDLADLPLVVASYVHSQANGVLSAVCETTAATQRRRQTRLR